jgi:hypothetical protein
MMDARSDKIEPRDVLQVVLESPGVLLHKYKYKYSGFLNKFSN